MYFLHVYFSIFYNDYFQNVNKIIFAYIIDNYIHLGDQKLLFNEYRYTARFSIMTSIDLWHHTETTKSCHIIYSKLFFLPMNMHFINELKFLRFWSIFNHLLPSFVELYNKIPKATTSELRPFFSFYTIFRTRRSSTMAIWLIRSHNSNQVAYIRHISNTSINFWYFSSNILGFIKTYTYICRVLRYRSTRYFSRIPVLAAECFLLYGVL